MDEKIEGPARKLETVDGAEMRCHERQLRKGIASRQNGEPGCGEILPVHPFGKSDDPLAEQARSAGQENALITDLFGDAAEYVMPVKDRADEIAEPCVVVCHG